MANMDEKMWQISKSFIDHYGPIFADLSSFNNELQILFQLFSRDLEK